MLARGLGIPESLRIWRCVDDTCNGCCFQGKKGRSAMNRTELPTCKPGDDEVTVLAQRKRLKAPGVTLNTPFTSLPPEIRNRVYELLLPPREDDLIIATPFKDGAMVLGQQPALARTCSMIRSETLPMFYADSRFTAYINNFDFTNLIAWCKQVASLSTWIKLPLVTVHVNLLTRIVCLTDLLDLAREWRNLNHDLFHLRIHNRYAGGPVYRGVFDQRQLVVEAVAVAEDLRAKGHTDEGQLWTEFMRRMTDASKDVLGCNSFGQGECLPHCRSGM